MKKAVLALSCSLMLLITSCSQATSGSSDNLEGSDTVMIDTIHSSVTDSDVSSIAVSSSESLASDLSSTSSGQTTTTKRITGSTTTFSTTAATTVNTPSNAITSVRNDVRISGRIYESSSGPWLSWSGTTVFANIKAATIQVKLRVIPAQQGSEADVGCDYVNVIIDDGTPVVLKLNNGSKDATPVYTIATNLTNTVHKVEIVKRTEGVLGPIQFEGFVLPNGGSFASPPTAPSRKIEFIGTSSLCGYGNEGSGGFKASEENAYMAFGLITARNLNAEQHTIAVSGGGIVRDYGGSQARVLLDMYKRVVPQFQSKDSAWSFSQWTPDAVVINMGDNDFAADTTLNDGVTFKQKLKELIALIRSNHPNAHIFCTSGLTGAIPVPKMAPFTQAVVNELNDSKVYYVSLHDQKNTADGMGANGHPSIKTHQRIATYLSQQIQAKTGW